MLAAGRYLLLCAAAAAATTAAARRCDVWDTFANDLFGACAGCVAVAEETQGDASALSSLVAPSESLARCIECRPLTVTATLLPRGTVTFEPSATLTTFTTAVSDAAASDWTGTVLPSTASATESLTASGTSTRSASESSTLSATGTLDRADDARLWLPAAMQDHVQLAVYNESAGTCQCAPGSHAFDTLAGAPLRHKYCARDSTLFWRTHRCPAALGLSDVPPTSNGAEAVQAAAMVEGAQCGCRAGRHPFTLYSLVADSKVAAGGRHADVAAATKRLAAEEAPGFPPSEGSVLGLLPQAAPLFFFRGASVGAVRRTLAAAAVDFNLAARASPAPPPATLRKEAVDVLCLMEAQGLPPSYRGLPAIDIAVPDAYDGVEAYVAPPVPPAANLSAAAVAAERERQLAALAAQAAPPVTSYASELLRMLLWTSVSQCAAGHSTACSAAANVCALQLHRDAAPGCVWAETAAETYAAATGSDDPTGAADDASYDFSTPLAFRGALVEGSLLPLRLRAYAVSGELLGAYDFAEAPLSLCRLPSPTLRYLQQSGVQNEVECEFDVGGLLAREGAFGAPPGYAPRRARGGGAESRTLLAAHAPVFFEAYVEELVGASAVVQRAVPFVVADADDGGDCDALVDDGKTLRRGVRLRRRVFVLDAASGTAASDGVTFLRYAERIHLRVRMDESGGVFLPHICVSYASVAFPKAAAAAAAAAAADAAGAASASSAYRVLRQQTVRTTWQTTSGDAHTGLAVSASILAGMCALATLVTFLTHARRAQPAAPAALLHVRGPTALAGAYVAKAGGGGGVWERADCLARIVQTPDGRWGVYGAGALLAAVSAAAPPPGPDAEVSGAGGEGEQLVFVSSLNACAGAVLPSAAGPWLWANGAPAGGVFVGAASSGLLALTGLDISAVRAFVRALLDRVGTALLAAVWIGSVAFFLEYKHGSYTAVVRPLPYGLGSFYPAVLSLVFCKLVAALLLYVEQGGARVVLLDWEVSGGTAAFTADAAAGHDGGAPKEISISMWRRVLVGNELNRLLAQRTGRTLWVLGWAFWLLHGLGYRALAKADPTLSTNHRTNYGAPRDQHFPDAWRVASEPAAGSTHPLLRFAVTGAFVLLASVVWWLLHLVYRWCVEEDPLARFVDLVTQSNVSVLFLLQDGFGYYIDGRKQLPGREGCDRADCSLAEWQEAQAVSGPPLQPVQREYEVFLSAERVATVRATLLMEGAVDSAATAASSAAAAAARARRVGRRQQGSARRPTRCFELVHGADRPSPMLSATPEMCREHDAAEESLRLLMQQGSLSALQKFPFSLHTLFGVPPQRPLNPMVFRPPGAAGMAVPSAGGAAGGNEVQLYAEPYWGFGPTWKSEVSLLGADASLHMGEMAIFVAIDSLTASLWFAAASCCAIFVFGIWYRRISGKSAMGRQALDPRLLLT
eukprot:Rhum_TRINITY_DN13850_c0_g1::Rhum_TRINITY_DN13850_c0_g1_i1::g.65087::m.65087